jgi:sporulation protein YlmC with PRC-barrel domain
VEKATYLAARLGIAPAIAQQQNTMTPPAKMPAQGAPALSTANNAGATNNEKWPSGSLKKYNGEWRASDLVGATIYDSQGDSLGTINDLLTDDSGKISQAVILTGGVLGIGGKLVTVQFDHLEFEPSAAQKATEPAGGTPTGNKPVSSGGNANPGTASQGHPVPYSVVLPNATKDTLNKEPTFKFASTG